jgi:hypothetical protein
MNQPMFINNEPNPNFGTVLLFPLYGNLSALSLLGTLQLFSPVSHSPSTPTISTPTPPPPLPKVTRGCMAGALFQNFFGNDEKAGLTVGLHVAAIAAAKRLAPSLFPGPTWLYTGVLIVYDAGTVLKSYAHCKYGGSTSE